jgi:hypothetical protein
MSTASGSDTTGTASHAAFHLSWTLERYEMLENRHGHQRSRAG